MKSYHHGFSGQITLPQINMNGNYSVNPHELGDYRSSLINTQSWMKVHTWENCVC